MMRYFAGFIATIALIILLIVLIFHGGGKPKVQTTSRTLYSYANTDAEASLTIDGPITADQTHQSIKIIVSRDTAAYQQIQGYQGNVQKQQTYNNNVDSYTNFLFAIGRAGFTEGDNSSSLKDERGYCPLGNRFIFAFNQDGKQLERYWTTNCSGTPSTFKGNSSLIVTLFQNQIPDYNTLSNDVNL
jgi:hypothetical protein